MTCRIAFAAAEPFCETTVVFPQEGADVHRIPSIVVTRSGVVLAFADRRKGSRADWGHDTDVVLRRSLDGGKTWQPAQTLAAHPGVCMHSGPAVVDYETGRVLKFYRYRPNAIKRPQDVAKHFARWREQGYANYVVGSDDDGKTWSDPRDMGLARPEKHRVGNGGHGVQLPGGRLLMNGGAHKGVGDSLKSFLLYSDDHGETWRAGDVGRRKGVVVEAATVVLADGSVMVNHRTEGSRRKVTIYADGGTRIVRTYVDAGLPEPFCHASLARYSLASEGDRDGDRDRILFVNPPNASSGRYDAGKRVNITMRLSTDDGATWPVSRSLYAGPSGYSDTAVLPDKTILCLFENGKRKYNDRISVARLNLAWLTAGKSE